MLLVKIKSFLLLLVVIMFSGENNNSIYKTALFKKNNQQYILCCIKMLQIATIYKTVHKKFAKINVCSICIKYITISSNNK